MHDWIKTVRYSLTVLLKKASGIMLGRFFYVC